MKNLFTPQSQWCWLPDVPVYTPCFAIFRRRFKVQREVCELRVNVTADNRYNLFLDSEVIGRGPCRSDLSHYHYETYTLALDPGEHLLSAEVVVYPYGTRGDEGPVAEMHGGSGFLVAGGVFAGGKLLQSLDTPTNWKCRLDPSRIHRSVREGNPPGGFTVIPPMEHVDYNQSLGDWKHVNFDDSDWQEPRGIGEAILRSELKDPYSRWWLVPRQIPFMEEKPLGFKRMVRLEGMETGPAGRDIGDTFTPIQIPAGKKVSITLDVGHLTTAFLKLKVCGGSGREVRITYAESLWVEGRKLARDHPDGVVLGYSDLLLLSGGTQVFETTWFRTLRFCRLDISDGPGDLTLDGLSLRTYQYPLELKGDFHSEQVDTSQLWEVAWRTARLCAHEHYYDCPYYEQLQYVGDTRIQALISYALTGDGRLGKQAIQQFDRSRLPGGLTQSRYPSYWTQVIPGFSLFWVMMVHDYFLYFGDKDFVRQMLPGIQAVLDWFERRRLENGIIGHCQFWNFWDWVEGWDKGDPAGGLGEPITLTSLVYAESCRLAGELYTAIKETKQAVACTDRQKATLQAVNRQCYDSGRKCYLDIPGKPYTSQHTNAWAIISGAVTGDQASALADRIASDPEMSQATLYFTFYLFRAWEAAGRHHHFWGALEKWDALLKYGFTTFPENPSLDSRSDCHAWSSSPMYELVTRVVGLQPGSPGCKTIKIQPHPGPLTQARGRATLNDQLVSAAWKISGNEMTLWVECQRESQVQIFWPDGVVEEVEEVISGEFRKNLL